MKYVFQFALILLISFIGELLNRWIPLPIPASIYGLILMLMCLTLKIIPLSAVRETGHYLIAIMPVMFIPSAVGLIDSWGVLKPIALPVLAITLASTFLVMGAAGLSTQALIRRAPKKAARTKEAADK